MIILNPRRLQVNSKEMKMKKMFFVAILIVADIFTTYSQSQNKVVQITYKQAVNGKIMHRGGRIILMAGTTFSESCRDTEGIRLIAATPEEKEFVNYENKTTVQLARLKNGEVFHVESPFSEYPELTYTGEKDEIMGYPCEKARTTLRSNSIDIWFTRATGFRGTPQMAYGIPDGLVLKIVRNNNFEIVADTLVFPKRGVAPVLPAMLGEKVDQALYRHKITQNYVTAVTVFDDEQISWGNPVENPQGNVLNETYRYAGGTVILKKVKLPAPTSDYQVFAEVTQYSNGDAYDRTGTAFLIPEGKKQSFLQALQEGIDKVPSFTARNGKTYQGMVSTPDFSPAVELLRFFTPFGIRQYNEKVKVYGQTWENAAWYKQEVTDLLPLLQEEVWMGMFIGNYDKGGHKVSLQLKYYPGSQEAMETAPQKAWIMPLFNTLNIMEMAGQEYGTLFDTDSLTVVFEVPEGIQNLKLRYITTGHGGWGGGDEFNQKENRVIVDGNLVYGFTPWRTDCGTYRKYNPSSGNFWNGLTSSDYSRSGWCPGSTTNPVYIPMEGIGPGLHVMQIAIPQGKPEGSSFSAWSVSGVLTGEWKSFPESEDHSK